MTVTPDEVEAFQRDGAVCIRGVLSPDEVEVAHRGVARVLTDLGLLALEAARPDDPGRFVEDFRRWQDVPEIEAIARSPRLGEIAGRLMGAQRVRLHHDHVLVKEPGTRQRTPWHQDLPYYDVEGTQLCSAWIPLDPVPRGSSLEVVAGTHLGPWYLPRTFKDGEAKWFPEGSLAELPDIDGDPDRWPVLSWQLEPGDAIVFHVLALHAAGGVPGPDRRRVVSIRLAGDDVVRAPRPWRTSPPFPELGGVPAGTPLDGPLFPVVWERAAG
jgi:ectoine hydroxylase-related dioxygenase (phytanoyl-CoA dioxygenase family)